MIVRIWDVLSTEEVRVYLHYNVEVTFFCEDVKLLNMLCLCS
jgi:hypothetical protein